MKRYFYTYPRRGLIAHRCFSKTKTEGSFTACGRLVPKGWLWSVGPRAMPICQQCEKASV